MNRELWVSVLTFLATIITIAASLPAIPSEWGPWLTFAVAVINAALTIFFGVTGFRTRAAAKAAAAKK